MKILFFDIETTGFNRTYDSIIEIAGIVYDQSTNKQVAKFHEYIKPKKPIPPHITEITGITNAQVANCRSEKEVLLDFIEFIYKEQPNKYLGHNIDAFDYLWMRDKSLSHGSDFPVKETIDTLKLARKLQVATSMFTATGRPSYRQESIAAAMGIKYDAHSAIADVEALIEIYLNMTEGMEVVTADEERANKRKALGF